MSPRAEPCERCNGERYVEVPSGRAWEGNFYVPCPQCNDVYGAHLRKANSRSEG